MNDNLDFLDVLTLLSFYLQVLNQQNIISMGDVQDEVNRAITEIHKHLEEQDKKIDTILKEILQYDQDKTVSRPDKG